MPGVSGQVVLDGSTRYKSHDPGWKWLLWIVEECQSRDRLLGQFWTEVEL